jgi:hypothetical protein
LSCTFQFRVCRTVDHIKSSLSRQRVAFVYQHLPPSLQPSLLPTTLIKALCPSSTAAEVILNNRSLAAFLLGPALDAHPSHHRLIHHARCSNDGLLGAALLLHNRTTDRRTMGARLRVDTPPEGVEEAHGWLELPEFHSMSSSLPLYGPTVYLGSLRHPQMRIPGVIV